MIVHDLIQSAKVVGELSAIANTPIPVNEGQARELKPLRGQPEVMKVVMQEAASTGTVTAKKIRRAVRLRLPEVPEAHARQLHRPDYDSGVFRDERAREFGNATPSELHKADLGWQSDPKLIEICWDTFKNTDEASIAKAIMLALPSTIGRDRLLVIAAELDKLAAELPAEGGE